MGFKCSLNEEKIRGLAMRYYSHPDIEAVVPHKHDRVLHPTMGFSTVYIDHLKVGLHLPLFSLLMNIFNAISFQHH